MIRGGDDADRAGGLDGKMRTYTTKSRLLRHVLAVKGNSYRLRERAIAAVAAERPQLHATG